VIDQIVKVEKNQKMKEKKKASPDAVAGTDGQVGTEKEKEKPTTEKDKEKTKEGGGAQGSPSTGPVTAPSTAKAPG